MFTAEEFKMIAEIINHDSAEYRKNYIFSEKICVLHIQRRDSYQYLRTEDNCESDSINKNKNHEDDDEYPGISQLLQLNNCSKLTVTQIDDSQINKYLNDNNFNALSKTDKFLVKFGINQAKMLKYKITNSLSEAGLSVILFMIEKFLKNN